MTTLGRASSFRTVYQAALHDLAAMTAERDALLRFIEKQADAERRADTYFNAAETATARAEAAETEVTRLREALGFYADAVNYRSYWHEGRLPIIEDLGKRALTALAQKEAPHD